MGLAALVSLLRVSPTLPMAQGAMSAPRSPLDPFPAMLQLRFPTALHCLATGLAEPGSQPVLALSCLYPQGGAQFWGLGLPLCPLAVLLLAKLEEWAQAARFFPTSLHGYPYGSTQGAQAPFPQVLLKASGLGLGRAVIFWLPITGHSCKVTGMFRTSGILSLFITPVTALTLFSVQIACLLV